MNTNGHGQRDSDDLIVAALASGASYAEAAKAGRCSKSTVRRQMADPEFRGQVAAARRELVEVLRGRLLHAAPSALETLEELRRGARAEPVRLSAARAILSFACEKRLDPFAETADRLMAITPRDHDAPQA